MKTICVAIAVMLVLMACDKQGPMGPEGPQGPQGPNGSDGTGTGGGISKVVSFTMAANSTLDWEAIDGWQGYVVWGMNTPNRNVTLPDSLVDDIEKGMALVYFESEENDWYRLPFTVGADNTEGHEIYDYYFVGSKLTIYAKTKGSPSSQLEPNYSLKRLKVIIAPATEERELKLSD